MMPVYRPRIWEYILGHLTIVDGFSLVKTMCDAAFIQENPAISATHALSPNRFVAVVLLLTKFRFSSAQLKWLYELRRRRSSPTDPTAAALLDLNSLPLAKTNAIAVAGTERGDICRLGTTEQAGND